MKVISPTDVNLQLSSLAKGVAPVYNGYEAVRQRYMNTHTIPKSINLKFSSFSAEIGMIEGRKKQPISL